jgi:hypothetical protein
MKYCRKPLNSFCLILSVVELFAATSAYAAIEGGDALKGKDLAKEK